MWDNTYSTHRVHRENTTKNKHKTKSLCKTNDIRTFAVDDLRGGPEDKPYLGRDDGGLVGVVGGEADVVVIEGGAALLSG